MDPIDAAIGPVPEAPYTVPLGKAKVVRPGKDVTIVALQMMTHYALEAADRLAEQGIEAEVIDLRSLVPLDRETILQSVRKTHRLVVVDEDYRSYGVTAEVAALAAEEAMYDLEAPIRRLAIPDVPIPYSRPLEQRIIPGPQSIFDTVVKLMEE